MGVLDTDDGIAAVAEEMLADPRSRDALNAYFTELFGLEALDSVIKVPAAFPDLESTIEEPIAIPAEFGISARRETLALLDDLVWEQDSDVLEFLTADYTIVDPLMEALYLGEVASGQTDPDGAVRVELPAEQQRSGILGHMGLLSMHAQSNRTAPTLRGKFIKEVLMCDAVPPPPDDVEFELPSDNEAPTLREKLEAHQDNPACAACHVPLDGLGFALEHYDGLGFYRTTENGFSIDASADVAELGAFDGAQELGERLRASAKVPHCLVKRLFRHAVGRVEGPDERDALQAMVDAFVADEHRLQTALLEIVTNPAFATVAPTEDGQ